MVVEGDDSRKHPVHVLHPGVVDSVQPGMIEDGRADAFVREPLGRTPGVRQEDRAVADDRDVVPGFEQHATTNLESVLRRQRVWQIERNVDEAEIRARVVLLDGPSDRQAGFALAAGFERGQAGHRTDR